MIYLGFDYGEKRIGVARSDELGMFAEPAGLILCKKFGGSKWDDILRLVTETGARMIVVGLPRRTTGELNVEAKKVLEYVSELKTKVSCETTTWDERFTTKEADRILRELGVKVAKKKEKRDSLAAAVMLQSYLDYQRLGNKHVPID